MICQAGGWSGKRAVGQAVTVGWTNPPQPRSTSSQCGVFESCESKTMTSSAAGVSTAQVVQSNIQIAKIPVHSTFQTVLTDQPAADIQAASRSTAGLSKLPW